MAEDLETKMDKIESRILSAEKSNRSMLKEVTSFKNELRSQLRNREEDTRHRNLQHQQQLEKLVRVNTEIVGQLSDKLRAAEAKIDRLTSRLDDTQLTRNDEKVMVKTLMRHMKQVEDTALLNQEKLRAEHSQQQSLVDDMRDQLNDLVEAVDVFRDQLDSSRVEDNIRQLRRRYDGVVDENRRLQQEQQKLKSHNTNGQLKTNHNHE